ncbi:MAG: hypothetical protein QMD77_03325 [Patescibacteria group bacterium]|nr:hypothetical protein [Patescibacteria group bacterium]
MRKKWILSILSLSVALFLIIPIIPSMSSAAEKTARLKWGWRYYRVWVNYDRQNNKTTITTKADLREECKPDKSSVSFPGFVEAKVVKNFCGPGKDAVVLIFRNGSGGNMKYEVCKVNPRTARLVNIPNILREIPAGEIKAGDGAFLVFSGVRYSIAYFQEGFVVEETPLATVVKKDTLSIIFSQREDGVIETFPPDLTAKGIQVRIGQKLFFLRNDLNEPIEDIRCEGLVMVFPPDEPCARTFPKAGSGFITIEIERKLVNIPLTVTK